jgi:hypothetical protein
MEIEKDEMGASVLGRKKRLAELLCDPDCELTVAEILREIGITRATLHRWLCDEGFSAYLDALVIRFAKSEKPNVIKALVKKAKGGDVSAIKLYFEAVQGKKDTDTSEKIVIIAGEENIEE